MRIWPWSRIHELELHLEGQKALCRRYRKLLAELDPGYVDKLLADLLGKPKNVTPIDKEKTV